MMKTLIATLLIVPLLACSSLSTLTTYKLAQGMSEEEVTEVMGTPDAKSHGRWMYWVIVAGDMWGRKVPYYVRFNELGELVTAGQDERIFRTYQKTDPAQGLINMSTAIRNSTYQQQPIAPMNPCFPAPYCKGYENE